MQISAAGVKLIQDFEACARIGDDGLIHSYPDECKPPVWTIGWGSTYYENGQQVRESDPPITQERADEIFMHILNAVYVRGVDALMHVPINQNQFDALVSFAYNCEVYNLQTSTLLRRVLANQFDPTIREAFLMWDKDMQDGQLVDSPGLIYRRGREADLYFTPV